MGKKGPAKWATPVEPKPPVILSYADTAEEKLRYELYNQKIHEVISFLPLAIQVRVGKELYFKIEPPSSVLATYFPKNASAFIRLKEELFDKTSPEIAFIIAHEVAHHIRNHRYADSKDELFTLFQELEAEELTIKWLKDKFPEETLREFLKIPRDKK